MESSRHTEANSSKQQSGTSSDSSSEADPTTSVEASNVNRTKAGAKSPEVFSSSTITTTSPLTSRSSADVLSEILVDAGGSHSESHKETLHSNASTPVSVAAAGVNYVHGHLLPSGWSCKYFPSTDEYSFEYNQEVRPKTPAATQTGLDGDADQALQGTPTWDDTAQTSRRPTLNMFECNYGYHFPTSPTSSMISELAQQVQKTLALPPGQRTEPKMRQIGYGKHKLMVPTDEAEQVRRLKDMFPTATQPVIEQMIQIYHGREGLIKAALISLGYKRVTEYNKQQASAQSPIMLMMSKPSSKKLFDKLVGYFPDKDETLIKNLMYKHKEVEHEIISALVELGQDASSGIDPTTQSHIDKTIRQTERSGAIMKLRYLKFLYPTCQEIELYHLLHCSDLNAQRVMEIVEKRGHQRINMEEVLKNRKSQTQQMRAQQVAQAARDQQPTSAKDLVEAHIKRTKPNIVDARKKNLLGNLRNTFEALDETLGLGALEAADYNEALAKKFIEEMQPVDEILFKQRYQLPTQPKPDVVAFPCKSIQKGDTSFMSIVANESVYIERDIIECDHALALLKVDASTYTQEDFPRAKFTHRQGRVAGLRKGPAVQHQANVHRKTTGKGPESKLRCGSSYKQICENVARAKPNAKALGHQDSLVRGHNAALMCGHNPALVRRTHPFFLESVAS